MKNLKQDNYSYFDLRGVPSEPRLDTPERRLGHALRVARIGVWITQERVAEVLGVSVCSVQNWEQGKRSPDVFTLRALAALYGASLDGLLVTV